MFYVYIFIYIYNIILIINFSMIKFFWRENKSLLSTLTYSLELIIISVTIYILLNYHKNVIKDSGLYSYILISIGFILKSKSNYFIYDEEIKNCYLYTFFSSMGFIIIYITFTIKIIISSTFALKFNNCRKDIILMSYIFSYPLLKRMFIPNKESKYSNVYSSPSKKDNQEESKNYFEQIHSKVSIKYDSYSVKYEPMSYTPKTEIKSHKASINSTHSNDNKTELQSMDNRTEINSSSSLYSPTQKILTIEQRFELIIMMAYVEMFITILLSIVVFVFNIINIIINRNSELSFVQVKNNNFSHICPYKKINTILYVIESILLFFNILNIKLMFEGRYIFKESRVICLISLLWAFMDPGFNVNTK